jgi:hypothetical protein
MADGIYRLLLEIGLVILVSAVYAAWIWSRLRIGRYDALTCSVGIILMQLIASFRAENLAMSLAAVVYHIALVAAVFSAHRGLIREKEKAKVKVKA